MPQLPQPGAPATTARDLLYDALIEIGAIAQSQAIPDNIGQWGLRKLNRLMDLWAARKLFVYDQAFTLYTLTANLNPHTIGPSGTFVVTQRPVKILSAAVVLGSGSSAVDVPLALWNDDEWAENRVKALTSTQPVGLFYGPSWPNGTLNLWPVPTVANGLRLETWTTLSQFATLDTPLSLPPGYWDAIVKSLAIDLCPGFERSAKPELIKGAMDARAAIQSNNSESPLLTTAQVSMPTPGKRSDFNYRTGM